MNIEFSELNSILENYEDLPFEDKEYFIDKVKKDDRGKAKQTIVKNQDDRG